MLAFRSSSLFIWRLVTCAVSTILQLAVYSITSHLNAAQPLSYADIEIAGARHVFGRFHIGRGKFSSPTLSFAYFGDFSLHLRSFDSIITPGLKPEFSAPVFLKKIRSIQKAQHHFRRLS